MFCLAGFNYLNHKLSSNTGNYLEIGVFNGDSIATLARNYPHLTIYGVDPFVEDGCTTHTSRVQENEHMPDQRANTHANIAGLPNIVLNEEFSSAFADRLTDAEVDAMKVRHVLIDGSHHYKDVIIDVHLAMRLIGNHGGSIVFDDVNLPDVRRAYDEFLEIYSGRYAPVEDLSHIDPGHILGHVILPQ